MSSNMSATANDKNSRLSPRWIIVWPLPGSFATARSVQARPSRAPRELPNGNVDMRGRHGRVQQVNGGLLPRRRRGHLARRNQEILQRAVDLFLGVQLLGFAHEPAR